MPLHLESVLDGDKPIADCLRRPRLRAPWTQPHPQVPAVPAQRLCPIASPRVAADQLWPVHHARAPRRRGRSTSASSAATSFASSGHPRGPSGQLRRPPGLERPSRPWRPSCCASTAAPGTCTTPTRPDAGALRVLVQLHATITLSGGWYKPPSAPGPERRRELSCPPQRHARPCEPRRDPAAADRANLVAVEGCAREAPPTRLTPQHRVAYAC